MTYSPVAPGDPITSDGYNVVLSQGIIPCLSTARPTDTHEGMTIFETDTGWHLTYAGGRFIYLPWFNPLWDATNAIVGTAPADPGIVKPQGVNQQFIATVTGTDGFFAVNYPTAFNNCIFGLNPTPGDIAGGLVMIVPIFASLTLAGFFGQALKYVGDGTFAVVDDGTDIRFNLLVTGC